MHKTSGSVVVKTVLVSPPNSSAEISGISATFTVATTCEQIPLVMCMYILFQHHRNETHAHVYNACTYLRMYVVVHVLCSDQSQLHFLPVKVFYSRWPLIALYPRSLLSASQVSWDGDSYIGVPRYQEMEVVWYFLNTSLTCTCTCMNIVHYK